MNRKQVSIINNEVEVIKTNEENKKYIVIMGEMRDYKYVTYAKNEEEAMENVDNGKHEGEEEVGGSWECISVREEE